MGEHTSGLIIVRREHGFNMNVSGHKHSNKFYYDLKHGDSDNCIRVAKEFCKKHSITGKFAAADYPVLASTGIRMVLVPVNNVHVVMEA